MDKTQSHEKCSFGGVNPAVRVHAVLGNPTECKTPCLKQDTTAKLRKLLHTNQTLAITQKETLQNTH
jgi:hypothetical protein